MNLLRDVLASLWRHKWARRTTIFVSVLVAARLLLAISTPFALDWIVASRDLRCEYDAWHLSMMTGELEVTNLRLRHRDVEGEGGRLVEIEHLYVDLDVLATASGSPSIARAEIDGGYVIVERLADGRVWWLDFFRSDDSTERREIEADDSPLDFTLPLQADALRLHHFALRFLDRSTTPNTDITLDIDARLSELGRKAHFDVWLRSGEVLEALHIAGQMQTSDQRAQLSLGADLERFRASPLAAQLAAFGVRPTGDELSGSLALRVDVGRATTQANALRGVVALEHVELTAAGRPALEVEATVLEIEALDAAKARLTALEIIAPRLWAAREADGALSAAGFALSTPSPDVRDEPLEAAPSSQPYTAFLERFSLRDGHIVFADRSIPGAETIDFLVDSLALNALAYPLWSADTGGAPAALAFVARAPGIVERIEIDGDQSAGAGEIEVRLAARAEGLTLARLRPQLAELGLEPVLRAAESQGGARIVLRQRANGWGASFALEGLRLFDGAELASLGGVTLDDFVYDERFEAFEIGSLEIEGLRGVLSREAGADWSVLGLTRRVSTAPPAPDEIRAPRGELKWPRAKIGRLHCGAVELHVRDSAVEPNLDETLQFDFDLQALDALSSAPQPASWHARGIAGHVVAEFAVQGELALGSAPTHANLRAELRARGIATEVLRPYLRTIDLEPTLVNGTFDADLELDLRSTDEDFALDTRVHHVGLFDGETELAGVESALFEGVRFGGERIEVKTITIDAPRIGLARDASGALQTLGLRVLAPQPSDVVDEPSEPKAWTLELPAVALGSARITNGSVRWNDASLQPNVATELRCDAALNDWSVSENAVAAPFSVRARLEGCADELKVDGTLSTRPDALEIEARWAAAGLRAGPLNAYLAPRASCEWVDASASASTTLRIARADVGGLSAHFEALDARFSSGERNLASCEHFEARAARLDPLARHFAIEAVAARGIELEVRRDRNGFQVLGVHALTSGDTPATESPDVATTLKSSTRAPAATPTVFLGPIALEVRRLRYIDETLGPDAAPIDASLAFARTKAGLVLSPETSELEPLEWTARASILPLIDELTGVLTMAPFAREPEFRAALAVRGIRGESLSTLAPNLGLDARGLQSGEVDLELEGRVQLTRRAPLDIDWNQGIAGELELRRAELRASPGGEVLAGLRGAHVELGRFDPISGDVRLTSLRLLEPRLRVRRDAEGLHALGLTFALPDATASESAEPAAAPTHPLIVPAPAGPDFACDSFVINGLDVVVLDQTAQPEVSLPLVGLDLEVKRFSTHALAAGGQVPFSAYFEPGSVLLPRRVESDSLLEGLVTAAAAVIAGEDEAERIETRPLFEAATMRGRIGLWPEPAGWAAFEVEALELGSLRGLAVQQGLELGDGLLDLGVRARLAGRDGIAVDADLSFVHLALSEPADGPIARYLSLPAPLDTVLFLLEDAEGRHRVPVGVQIAPEGLSTGALLRSAASAAGAVIARAVASSPLRLLGTVSDAAGITGGAEEVAKGPTCWTPFAAADATLEVSARAALAEFIDELDGDQVVVLSHELVLADVERAQRLANPSTRQCLEMAQRLRLAQAELTSEHERRAAATRVDFALGRTAEAEQGTRRLREIAREIADHQNALDVVTERLLPSADRRRDARTRAAALANAAQRLTSVRNALIELGLAPERIEERPVRAKVEVSTEKGGVRALTRRKT